LGTKSLKKFSSLYSHRIVQLGSPLFALPPQTTLKSLIINQAPSSNPVLTSKRLSHNLIFEARSHCEYTLTTKNLLLSTPHHNKTFPNKCEQSLHINLIPQSQNGSIIAFHRYKDPITFSIPLYRTQLICNNLYFLFLKHHQITFWVCTNFLILFRLTLLLKPFTLKVIAIIDHALTYLFLRLNVLNALRTFLLESPLLKQGIH